MDLHKQKYARNFRRTTNYSRNKDERCNVQSKLYLRKGEVGIFSKGRKSITVSKDSLDFLEKNGQPKKNLLSEKESKLRKENKNILSFRDYKAKSSERTPFANSIKTKLRKKYDLINGIPEETLIQQMRTKNDSNTLKYKHKEEKHEQIFSQSNDNYQDTAPLFSDIQFGSQNSSSLSPVIEDPYRNVLETESQENERLFSNEDFLINGGYDIQSENTSMIANHCGFLDSRERGKFGDSLFYMEDQSNSFDTSSKDLHGYGSSNFGIKRKELGNISSTSPNIYESNLFLPPLGENLNDFQRLDDNMSSNRKFAEKCRKKHVSPLSPFNITPFNSNQ